MRVYFIVNTEKNNNAIKIIVFTSNLSYSKKK